MSRLADLVHHRGGQTVRRNRAGRIARMDARLLDVFHHAHDDNVVAVGHAIDVHLGGVLQEAVDQHGLALSDHERLGDEPFELRGVVTNLHRPPAQHEARPHQRRKADLRRFQPGLFEVAGDAVGGLIELKSDEQLLELFAVLGRLDGVDAGADDRHAGCVQGAGPG